MQRRSVIAAAMAAALSAPRLARAAWPADRPIQVFCPGPAGGGMDVLARSFLPFMQRSLPGANFVVINRPTAAGQQAFEGVATAAPDGFSIGVAQSPNSVTLPIERQVRYRVQDFTFLGNVIDDPCGLWVKADSPIASLAALIAEARAQPGTVTIGTAGVGSDDHLLILSLQEAAGVEFSHVPFNGTPPIVTNLLSRSIAAGSFNMSEGLALMREGALRGLAQGGAERWGPTATVPTFRDQGVAVLGGSTRGVVAPPNLPTGIRDRLRQAVITANADPAWIAEAERLNLPRRPMSAEAQERFFLDEDARLRALWSRKPWRE